MEDSMSRVQMSNMYLSHDIQRRGLIGLAPQPPYSKPANMCDLE